MTDGIREAPQECPGREGREWEEESEGVGVTHSKDVGVLWWNVLG